MVRMKQNDKNQEMERLHSIQRYDNRIITTENTTIIKGKLSKYKQKVKYCCGRHSIKIGG
jgi:hypothetical protein